MHGYQPLTDPSYISEQMFDRVAFNKFFNNTDDLAVRMQAIELVRILRASQSRDQIITDILHAKKVAGVTSAESFAEIAFSMGLQFGFELAISYPPLNK